MDVIRRGSMVDATVVPDGNIMDVLPLETHLQVVVLHDELHEPVEEMPGFLIAQPVDALDVVPDSEHRLPSCDRVRANNRVDRLEDLAHVFGCATCSTPELKVVLLCRLVEAGLGVEGRQSVEEVSQRRRDAIVELVA